jgi:hypothetical protein
MNDQSAALVHAADTLEQMEARYVDELSPKERIAWDAYPEGTAVRYVKAHANHNPHLRVHLGQAAVVCVRWASYDGVHLDVEFTESDWQGYGRAAPRFTLRPRYLEVLA